MLSENVVINTLQEVADKYPDAFKSCHKEGDPAKLDFIILGGRELNKLDSTVGMNGKRGNVKDPSMDAIWNDGRVVDVVVGAGGDNPSIGYNDVTSSGPGAFVNPFDWETSKQYGNVHSTLLGGSLFPLVTGWRKYPDRVMQFLAEYADMHTDYLRWFFTVGGKSFENGDPWANIGAFYNHSSHRQDTIEAFKIARQHHFKSHVVLFGTHEQWVDFGYAVLDRFLEVSEPYLNDIVLLEVANEYSVNDFSSQEIREIARYLKARLPAGFPITLSSPTTCHDPASTINMIAAEVEKMYAGDSGANHFTMHNSRPEPVWNPATLRPHLGDEIPIWDSEGRGPKASAGGDVNDPKILGDDYLIAIEGDASGKVFHSQCGVWIGYCEGYPEENEYKVLTDIPNWPEIKKTMRSIRLEGGTIDNGGGEDMGALHPYPDENGYWIDFTNKAKELFKKAGRTDVVEFLDRDPQLFMHWTRTTFDLADTLTPEQSAEKHLNDLADMLGVPRG